MNWQDYSEATFGGVMDGTISISAVRSEIFCPPYDRGIQLWKDGKDKSAILSEIGPDAFKTSSAAWGVMQDVNGHVDLPTELEKHYVREVAANDLEVFIKSLRGGKEPRWSFLSEIANNGQAGLSEKFLTWNEIPLTEDETEWQKSGVAFLDRWIGGIPEIGLWTVGGIPKVGKTSFAGNLAISFLKEHPDKNVIFFTIEMTSRQLKRRMMEFISDGDLSEDSIERFFIVDTPVEPEQVVNWSASKDNVGLIIVDFADLLIRGLISEQEMSALYRTLSLGAKSLGTSICLLVQLSNMDGNIPRPQNVRYSRLSEALVVMQLMLYVPQTSFYQPTAEAQAMLPMVMGKGYVCKWLTRFKTVEFPGLPIAIQVGFEGETGWDVKDVGRSILLNS